MSQKPPHTDRPRRRFPRPSPAALRGGALLTLLLAGALLLRAWGVSWGLPHAERYYPYHPDESVLLNAVCQVNPLWGDFRPGFYNYGSLSIFLSRLAYDLSAPFLGWGTVPQGRPFSEWVTDFAHLLLAARWVTVLLGVQLVWVTFQLGGLLFGRRAGWIAAVSTAAAPILVLLGHYMTVDVPAALFTTLSLVFAAVALRQETAARTAVWVAAGGFAAGLAAGTKYNSLVAILPLAVPLWMLARRPGGRNAAGGALAGAAAACAAGFALSTPGALIDTERFWADLSYELWRNREGQGLIFKETPTAALYHLGISLPVGLEWPLFLLSLAGVGWSMWRRRPEDVLLWLFLLPSFLLLATSERKFVRYVVPLIPPLLVLAARVMDEGLQGPRRRLWAVACGVAGAGALASSIAHLGVLSAPDARDQAAGYLRTRAAGSIVALGADAWYYTPPVHPTTGCVKVATMYGGPPVWDRFPPGERPVMVQLGSFFVMAPRSTPTADARTEAERLPQGALKPDLVRQYAPGFVVLSDFEYEDPERIRRADPSFQSGILELQEELRARGYRPKEFRPRPSLFGLQWWARGIPPHDWRYPMPTVRIWEKPD